MATVFTQWHIQCQYPRLEDIEDKTDYVDSLHKCIDRLWRDKAPQVSRAVSNEIPPKLAVDDVENATMTYRGCSTSVVRVRFKLANNSRDEGSFHRAVRHFCARVFDMKQEGNVLHALSLITQRSILGIEPLSSLFRTRWTRCFLESYVHKKVNFASSISHASFFTNWFGGVAIVLTAGATGNPKALFGAIGDALKLNLIPETRKLDSAKILEVNTAAKEFSDAIVKLERILGDVSLECADQLHASSDFLDPDEETILFDTVLIVLEKGFNLLTLNKELFDEWQKIVLSAEQKYTAAGANFGLGLALGGLVAVARHLDPTTMAGGLKALVVALQAPLALYIAIGVGVGVLGLGIYHLLNYLKAEKEQNSLERQAEEVQGMYEHVKGLAAWLIVLSKPETRNEDGSSAESDALQNLRAKLRERGLNEVDGLRAFKVAIDSERDLLKKLIKKSKENPESMLVFS